MGPDWLKNNRNQQEPIRLELLSGQTQRNKLAAAVGRFEENKIYLIHAKFCRIKENDKYINQSTSNWTIGQHKRGLTKLLKAYNRGFPYAAVRNEG